MWNLYGLLMLALGVGAVKDYCLPDGCGDVDPSRFDDLCKDAKWKMEDRCCRNGTSIIGLDLRNCSLSSASILEESVYKNVTFLDLSQNPTLKSIDEDAFDGYLALDHLFLDRSPNVSCPGGENSWKMANGGDNGERRSH